MKRLLLLGLLLPLVACGAKDDENKTNGTNNFIYEDGQIIRNGHPTGERFPLTKRHWFETNKGGAAAIFIDIPAINVMNGLCTGGTAFKHHESGGLIMKCFNINNSNEMKQMLLFETKDHHYFEPGYCDSRSNYIRIEADTINTAECTPALYYSMGDVGDKLPLEECNTILDKAWRYNFDFLCQ